MDGAGGRHRGAEVTTLRGDRAADVIRRVVLVGSGGRPRHAADDDACHDDGDDRGMPPPRARCADHRSSGRAR
ncbi:MAG: hypothetical protein ACRCZD_12565 [Phycicoccus sp.]